MNYDCTLNVNGIGYGMIKGNNEIVFIKLGLGGCYLDCEDKYHQLVSLLSENYGCCIIIASNPHDKKSHVKEDKQALEHLAAQNGSDIRQTYFFGSSNGCTKGLELACAGISFKKMMFVNMPLMINFHRTKRAIYQLPCIDITAVFGENDPSFSYVPCIEGRFNNLKTIIVKQADHNFKGKTNEFAELGILLLGDCS